MTFRKEWQALQKSKDEEKEDCMYVLGGAGVQNPQVLWKKNKIKTYRTFIILLSLKFTSLRKTPVRHPMGVKYVILFGC